LLSHRHQLSYPSFSPADAIRIDTN
jgi:hypothetical protein